MLKTRCHQKLPWAAQAPKTSVFKQHLWHLYSGIIFVEAISWMWMLYVLLAISSPRKKTKKHSWHTPGTLALEIFDAHNPSMMALLL